MAGMRTLAVTQNITLDGSIEMLGDWFDPRRQDDADLLEEMHRQDSEPTGFLGRQTFEDLRGYWPSRPTTRPGSPTTSTGSRSTSSPRP